MKIGFTGTREGLTDKQRISLLDLMQKFSKYNHEFHHGDCVGADFEAAALAMSLGWHIVGHPPDVDDINRAHFPSNRQEECKSYLERNKDIVDCSFCMIACPKRKAIDPRSGTGSTVNYALKNKKIIYVVYPDGEVEKK